MGTNAWVVSTQQSQMAQGIASDFDTRNAKSYAAPLGGWGRPSQDTSVSTRINKFKGTQKSCVVSFITLGNAGCIGARDPGVLQAGDEVKTRHACMT